MRNLLILSMMLVAPSLAGCATNGELEVECEVGSNTAGDYRKCGVGGTISWSSPQSSSQIGGYFNPYQGLFSFDGSTVSIPSSGFFNVSVFDANGTVIGTYSNTWSLQSNSAVPQNANALDNWLSSVPSGVMEMRVDLMPFSVGYQQGLNTFSASAIQGGTNYGSSTTTFFSSSCGGDGPFLDPISCL